jgi:hypothetical protein
MEKKYFCEYDSGISIANLAETILNDPDLPKLKSIVIGMWNEDICDITPAEIFTMIENNKEKFQHIESLFIGDMDSEEIEISWIPQGNYENLLKALPSLKSLKIKGTEGLELGKLDHKCLEAFEIISGGLPVSAVNALKAANLPALKKLVLYSGDENYGYDCEMSDFADLAKKERFPNLIHLGFTNSVQQDELVEVILASDLLPQLTTIEISCGCLTDKGGQLILDAVDKLGNLKNLDASYHYMSDEMMEKLKALPFEVNVDDKQIADPFDDDDTGMYPMFTE